MCYGDGDEHHRISCHSHNIFLVRVPITIYFLSEWCRCGADMKNPRMGSTLAYIPFGDLIEAAQMRHYHKKYHKK